MARLFVCTAGTSIVTNLREALEPVGTFGIRMREKLKDAKAKTGDRFLADASAELNVLLSMKCAGDDEVVLLASDTNLGKAAADTVCTLVTADLGAAVRVVKVTGLQTTDARAFRRNRMHKPPGRHLDTGSILDPSGSWSDFSVKLQSRPRLPREADSGSVGRAGDLIDCALTCHVCYSKHGI